MNKRKRNFLHNIISVQADSLIASGTDWTLNASGTLEIVSDVGMADWKNNRDIYKERVARADIQNGVTDIESGAFYDCGSLTGLVISEGVTGIKENAFENCGSLERIMVPGSVKYIEWGAFYGCGGLTESEKN